MNLEMTRIKRGLFIRAVALGLSGGSVQAADLPSRKAPPDMVLPPVFSWTGFYGGLNIGGAFSSNAVNNLLGPSSGGSARSVAGGAQVGYNYQISPLLVVGFENDFQGTGLASKNQIFGTPSVRVPWFSTGRARAGLALLDSQLLVFGTAGFATGEVNDTGYSKIRVGWTAGGGLEWAFMPKWSIKAEYLYSDIYKNIKSDGLAETHAKFHTVRVGLNYHFDLFSPVSLGNR